MFSKAEVKRNLLGTLEVALLMPAGPKRFGNSYDEAVRSFLIPILLFPLTLAALYLYPHPDIANSSRNTLTLLFSLRLGLSWLMFFGIIYWMMKKVDHLEHFCRFVVGTNWLAIPATVIFFPVAVMLLSNAFTWDELYPFMKFLLFYTYAFTAFLAIHALIIPWELAGFIAFLAIMVDNNTLDLVTWVSRLFNAS